MVYQVFDSGHSVDENSVKISWKFNKMLKKLNPLQQEKRTIPYEKS